MSYTLSVRDGGRWEWVAIITAPSHVKALDMAQRVLSRNPQHEGKMIRLKSAPTHK